MHIKTANIIAKKLYSLYAWLGAPESLAWSSECFFVLIMGSTLMDGVGEAPLQGNFPYMPHWKTVIINLIFRRHLVKLVKLSLLKLKLHSFIFARRCPVNLITFFEVIEVSLRPGL